MTNTEWNRVVELLLELGAMDFCVFGTSDEGAEIVERLIELAVEESLK